jgi:hypothetical protein
MQYAKKSFTITPNIIIKGKKCMKPDCENEDIACLECRRVQGHWIFYKKQTNPQGKSQ